MKISLRILKKMVKKLEAIPADEIAQKLTQIGLEVEAIEDPSKKWQGIVVGHVIARDKHPQADRLSLCKVSDGTREWQVVCGAPNVTAGKKYPFATLGTKMPDGLEIKPVKLRGVESFGMLCSAKELGVSSPGEGLLELSDHLTPGITIANALGSEDVILTLNVTPNRGDALSHVGVARDLAALLETAITADIFQNEYPPLSISRKPCDVAVAIEDAEGCPLYTVSEMCGVRVAESPVSLKNLLESLGQRSVNNIVDATNLLMLMTGQPVHAFDARTIQGKKIIVKACAEKRKFKTLDGLERDLLAGDLLIAGTEGPLALAGIMGGENSEIKSDTQDIVLEVAHFSPERIQKTARRLGINSESQTRFARFVDPLGAMSSHDLLQRMIVALAGGMPTTIEKFSAVDFKKTQITFCPAEIKRLLGIEIDSDKTAALLKSLGCEISIQDKTKWVVTAPSWRPDLRLSADLVEEVARLVGMESICEEAPRLRMHFGEQTVFGEAEARLKDYFLERGFTETVHYSFYEPDLEKLVNSDEATWARLANPLSRELSVLRSSHLPQLVQTLKKNSLLSPVPPRFFECRKIYQAGGQEARWLTAIFMADAGLGRNPFGLDRAQDAFDAKGLLSGILNGFNICPEWRAVDSSLYHPGQSVSAWSESGVELGRAGVLHPQFLQGFKQKTPLLAVELRVENLMTFLAMPRSQSTIQPLPELPPVYRDLALVMPKTLTHAEILQTVAAFKPKELVSLQLFDVYEGENLPEGKKSLAYALIYQPAGASMTDEEVNKIHFGLVDQLKQKLGIELR